MKEPKWNSIFQQLKILEELIDRTERQKAILEVKYHYLMKFTKFTDGTEMSEEELEKGNKVINIITHDQALDAFI